MFGSPETSWIANPGGEVSSQKNNDESSLKKVHFVVSCEKHFLAPPSGALVVSQFQDPIPSRPIQSDI